MLSGFGYRLHAQGRGHTLLAKHGFAMNYVKFFSALHSSPFMRRTLANASA